MVKDPTQMEMFETNDEITRLKKELTFLRQKCDQLKKGMASKYNLLAKLCLFLQEENSRLKHRIDELEKNLQLIPSSEQEEDDYLKKLFEEAYNL